MTNDGIEDDELKPAEENTKPARSGPQQERREGAERPRVTILLCKFAMHSSSFGYA